MKAARILGALSLAAMIAAPTTGALAADSGVSFAGKTVTIYIGFGAGGGYDGYARLVAKHLGDHLPGHPGVIAENMPGAGSMRLANWLYNVAPKDGTAIGEISRAVPFFPLIVGKQSGAQFDAAKFGWIGSANSEISTCVAWKGTGFESFEDLRGKQMILGGDGPSADSEQFARLMNGAFGTKIKIISGYSGGHDLNLAMERGEIQGRCGWSWSSIKSSHMDWIKDGTVNVLVQMGTANAPGLKDVPHLSRFATTDEQKKELDLVLARQPLGRPFLAPAGVSEDVLATFRKAFSETMKDEAFLADAKQQHLDIDPVSGTDVQSIVERVYNNTSPELAGKVRDMLNPS